MTTAYTPILKLALPQTGELSGTWGTVVNDNITLMVEQAVAGLATISTWTTNAHTLTTADGTTSEARCAMLVATNGAGGTALSGAGEIICPAATKLYVLRNNSSYAITLKVAASTGVAVPAGQTAFLFCDSAEVYACVTTIVDATISGNLTVNGNTTLGDAATDTITATGQFNTDLLPSTDNARDLGSTAKSWRTLYCDTSVLVGNLSLSGNTLSSTDSNGNIVIAPNGTGDVQLDADTVRVGDSAAAVTLTSNGAGALTVTTGGAANLVLSTNSGTTSGSITVTQGAGADIVLAPNGAGSVALPKLKVTGSSSGSVIIQAAAAAGSATYTLPSADGTTGQVLSTNGSGVLSWATGGGVTTFSAGTTGLTPSTATTGAITLGGTLAVANGGTGQTALSSVTVGAATNVAGGAANRIPVNTGAGTTSFIVAPTVSSFLQWDGSAFAWATSTATPAGSNTQVQYNNSGSFGASSAFTWNNTTSTLTVNSIDIGRGGGNVASNIAIGASTMAASATGARNIALGAAALNALTSGTYNIGIGENALNDLNTAAGNVAIGHFAGEKILDGSHNLLMGTFTGDALVSGAGNIGLGYEALGSVVTGSFNIGIGLDALKKTTQSYNIGIGYSAALEVTSGTEIVAIGAFALDSLVSNSNNVAVGTYAGSAATSADNTFVGNRAAINLTTGAGNVGLGNSVFGTSTVTGDNNVAVGNSAANTLTSGANNTILGYNATSSTATVSNEITLGNSSIATLRCQVTTITALSDARDKKNVQDIPLGIDFIQRLHPVSFVWNTRDEAKVDVPEFGFIAQELQQAQRDHGVTLPGLVYDINPERLEAAPGTLIPVLVKAVQELQAQIDDLKRQLAARG